MIKKLSMLKLKELEPKEQMKIIGGMMCECPPGSRIIQIGDHYYCAIDDSGGSCADDSVAPPDGGGGGGGGMMPCSQAGQYCDPWDGPKTSAFFAMGVYFGN